MGLLDRMRAAVRSNLNDLLDRMQDPGKEVDLLIDDMEGQLKEARREVVSAAAAEKRLAAQEALLADESATWERRASAAVKAGDDALAREALGRKQETDAKAASVHADRLEQQRYAADLKEQMGKLELRLGDVKSRRGTIKAQARAAKTGRSVGGAGGSAFSEFERLSNKIDDFQAEAEAEAELAMTGKEKDREVAAKFEKLEKGSGVEDALAELKRKLQK